MLGNLADRYADLGQTQRAIEFHEQALAIAREIGDRSGEGPLGKLANRYAALGQTQRAIEFTSRRWPSPAKSATAQARDTGCTICPTHSRTKANIAGPWNMHRRRSQSVQKF